MCGDIFFLLCVCACVWEKRKVCGRERKGRARDALRPRRGGDGWMAVKKRTGET